MAFRPTNQHSIVMVLYCRLFIIQVIIDTVRPTGEKGEEIWYSDSEGNVYVVWGAKYSQRHTRYFVTQRSRCSKKKNAGMRAGKGQRRCAVKAKGKRKNANQHNDALVGRRVCVRQGKRYRRGKYVCVIRSWHDNAARRSFPLCRRRLPAPPRDGRGIICHRWAVGKRGALVVRARRCAALSPCGSSRRHGVALGAVATAQRAQCRSQR